MQHVWLVLFLVLWGIGKDAKAADANADFSEELATEFVVNPFKTEIPPIDPISHQKVDQVLTGPVYKARKGAGFDYYRYVTFYNVDVRKERIHSLPAHREECFDDSEIFAGWSYSYSYSAKVSVGIQVEGLGLSTDFSETHTLTTNRNLKGHGKSVADHIPYLYKQDWDGLTYLQTLNTQTGKEEIVLKENNQKPLWMMLFLPKLAPQSYPMQFQVQDADWTFVVERTFIAACPGAENRRTRSSAPKNSSAPEQSQDHSIVFH